MGNAKLKQDAEGAEAFADELAPGAQLMHGQYTIESFLNAGGFGITYSARDSLDRRVVIKECFPGAFCRRSTALVTARSRAHQSELASIVRLFVQEARSLAKLTHPNIVGVHQVFEENNTAYMALDFIEGRDLLQIIEDGDEKLSPERIESMLRKVLDAVGFVHSKGVLHRDISPDNILLNAEGDPVLIDFGAAREEATKKSRVLSALRVVKDGYSPQEFYITGSEQGPYSDLYALGATFYHLITGDLPPNSQARLAAVASGEGDSYEPLVGRFDAHREPVLASIDKALAILPKDRVDSAATWIDMMDGKVAITPATINPDPLATAPAPANIGAKSPVEVPKKSNKGLLLAGVAVIGLIAAGVALQTGVLEVPATESGAEANTSGAETDTSAPIVADPVETPALAPEARAPIDGAVLEPVALPPELTEAWPTAEVWTRTLPGFDAEPAPAITSEAWPTANIWKAPLPGFDAEPAPAIASANWPKQNVWARPVIVPSVDIATDLDALFQPATLPTADSLLEQIALENFVPLVPPPSAVKAAPYELVLLPELPQPSGVLTSLEAIGSVPEEAAAYVLDGVTISSVSHVKFDTRPALDLPAIDTAVSYDPSVPAAPVAAETSFLTTEWAVILPYPDLFDQTDGKIRVFEVNGVPVDSIDSFQRAVRATVQDDSSASVTLAVLMGASDAVKKEQNWFLPVVQKGQLSNGMLFETVFENGAWVTRVAEVPANYSGKLQAGDVLYGHISSATILDTRGGLYEVLEREIEAGITEHSFAVKRGDATWVVSFRYDPAEYARNN